MNSRQEPEEFIRILLIRAKRRKDAIRFAESLLCVAQHDNIDPIFREKYLTYSSMAEECKFTLQRSAQGALGLLLLTYHAEQLRRLTHSGESSRWKEVCNSVRSSADTSRADRDLARDVDHHQSNVELLLSDRHVRDFLYDFYYLESRAPYRDSCMSLHAVGTTSLVLHLCSMDKVVKIIKPWYIRNDLIRDKTRTYQSQYRHISSSIPQYTPRIDFANERSIVMQYVAGPTLRQHFRTQLRLVAEQPEHRETYLRMLGNIAYDLCMALNTCSLLNPSVKHGDLTTTNAILGAPGDKPLLIDFGVNYLLLDRVGSGGEYRFEKDRTAPEVLALGDQATATVAGDMYALAVILVEGFLGDAFRAEDVNSSLDRVYAEYPGLGGLLDDLMDHDPNRRVNSFREPERTPYEVLAILLPLELELAAHRERESRTMWHGQAVSTIAAVLLPGIYDVIAMIRSERYRSKLLVHYHGSRGRLGELSYLRAIGLLGAVPIGLNVFIVAALVNSLADIVDLAREGFDSYQMWIGNWKGWLVGISFSIVAAKYSASIFAGLDPRDLSRAAWLTTLACMVLPWVPIVLAILWRSEFWPFLASLGVLLVTGNNLAWRELVTRGLLTMRKNEVRISDNMRRAAKDLDGWFSILLGYAIALFAIGILLRVPGGARFGAVEYLGLHDEWFYAILIAVGVNLKIYRFNVTSDAPALRSGIDRVLRGHRRAKRTRSVSGDG